GQLGRSEQRGREHVADRYAVLEGQIAIHGLEEQATLGSDADARELEPGAEVHHAHVSWITVREGIEVTAAGHHRGARQIDQSLSRAGPDLAHAPWRETRPLVGRESLTRQLASLPVDARTLPLGRGARGRSRPRGQDERRIELIVERLARIDVHREPGQ